jgi:hypothetical protein
MSDVLLRADKIAGGDRSRDYGHPKENHQRIAGMWNAYCSAKGNNARFTASDVAMMMILLKIARHIHTPKDDNIVDIAGYAKCVAMIDECNAANRNGVNGPTFPKTE